MTDLSAPLQTQAPTSPLARALRLPLTLVKSLFWPRPNSRVDLRYANEHFLRDIGLRR
ncbi:MULTISPECIES: hypothetical protein [Roseobacteraceae]|uniref:DUF1127 domain-containing protein n=2 Tax=Roseobacteraceae TaxID=2854170 RepID=A0A239KW79_9RHOB|nr:MULTISPECIES: hypothetical protein [Roseobacteraceae]SDL88938.1 hypothetical protein SAMN04488026_11276 [Aliiruegeria lutimaris]SNT21504.1 hypothetical protein SAMN05421757_10810 [Tropicimonas sediminicola]